MVAPSASAARFVVGQHVLERLPVRREEEAILLPAGHGLRFDDVGEPRYRYRAESPSIAPAVYPARGTAGGTVAREPHRRRGIGAAGSGLATSGALVESKGVLLKNVGIDSRIADISERSMRTRPDRGHLRRIRLVNFFRASQAETLGITCDRLRRLEAAGEVERVARGLYRLADAEPTEHYSLAAVCARVPNSVVCLPSALEVHEIGSRAPLEVWLAIPHKARPPRVSGVRVRLLRFSGAAWALSRAPKSCDRLPSALVGEQFTPRRMGQP